MTEFTSISGAAIVINLAPWEDAKELKKVIEREGAQSIIDMNGDLAKLSSLILKLDGSDAFEKALMPCLARCTRNGESVRGNTFDTKEGRSDYVEIVKACVNENIGPFVASLFSQFGPLLATQKTENVTQK